MIRLFTIQILMILVMVSCGVGTETVIKTGASARSQIVASGVSLPSSATDFYYAFQPQFSDHLDTWISFSAMPSDCMIVAQAVAGKKVSAPIFISGTRSQHDYVTGGPAYHHTKYASSYWNLSTIKHGKVFESKELFVLVDTDKNKVYISLKAP